jgi:hypothetical protein
MKKLPHLRLTYTLISEHYGIANNPVLYTDKHGRVLQNSRQWKQAAKISVSLGLVYPTSRWELTPLGESFMNLNQ